jgi:hypothetical protein
MKFTWVPFLGLALLMTTALPDTGHAAESGRDSRVFELRTYHAAPGKLDALHARFRDHTCKLFEKHGMQNVGYWTPLENSDHKLIYLLDYPSKEARDDSWKAFLSDPDWKKAQSASEKDGKLVTKVESSFLQTTDYSPQLKIEHVGDRVFELRTYTATPNSLDDLDARFKNHTMKLFAKHGMTNVVYFHLLEGQKGAENTLVYLLAHKSEEAGKKSFDGFRSDADWIAARKASEEKAGGSLTTEGGVKSVYMQPTDYSPLK